MASPAATLHSETLDRILSDYQAVAARLPDAAVPREARAQALRELSRYGWPKARDEQWRYTNLRAFEAVPAFAVKVNCGSIAAIATPISALAACSCASAERTSGR